MRQRFKDRGMQGMYETCRLLAADGVRPVGLVEDTLGYACWRAGMDDRKI